MHRQSLKSSSSHSGPELLQNYYLINDWSSKKESIVSRKYHNDSVFHQVVWGTRRERQREDFLPSRKKILLYCRHSPYTPRNISSLANYPSGNRAGKLKNVLDIYFKCFLGKLVGSDMNVISPYIYIELRMKVSGIALWFKTNGTKSLHLLLNVFLSSFYQYFEIRPTLF